MSNFTSARGMTLVWPGDGRGAPSRSTITIELWTKWYSLWLVHPSGAVEAIDYHEMREVSDRPYVDHVPSPKAVDDYAIFKGYDVCELAFEMIMGRWAIEVAQQ